MHTITTKFNNEEEIELRRGPWTLEEDTLLIHYISLHGEGHWNLLAKRAGLKRTGKSCRLRWLNYLKPDIKRGNLTPQEQLLILELHSKWGNRWSRIAQHLPGRTDNEIKNYWRTRVQKQARQLNIESNSKKFIEAVRGFWVPRLLQKMEQNTTNYLINTNCDHSLMTTIQNGQNSNSGSLLLPYNYTTHESSSSSLLSSSTTTSAENKAIETTTPFDLGSNAQIINTTRSDDQEEQQQLLKTTTSSLINDNGNNLLLLDDQNCCVDHDIMMSSYGIESLNLDPILEIEAFDILEPECQMAAGDWVMNDNMGDALLWNMGEM
ncbi:hypothetical protein CsatA_011712 [Cannabis sativa]